MNNEIKDYEFSRTLSLRSDGKYTFTKKNSLKPTNSYNYDYRNANLTMSLNNLGYMKFSI